MPHPFQQNPDNNEWSAPLPTDQTGQPGITTIPGGNQGGGPPMPLPSTPVSPIGGMPPAMASWTAAGAESGGILGMIARHFGHGAAGATDWLDVLKKLIPVAGVGGLAALLNHQQQSNDLPPELRDIMNLQKQRMEAQGPLYASILQLAKQRMPTSVQNAQLPAGSGPSMPAIDQLARNRNPNG